MSNMSTTTHNSGKRAGIAIGVKVPLDVFAIRPVQPRAVATPQIEDSASQRAAAEQRANVRRRAVAVPQIGGVSRGKLEEYFESLDNAANKIIKELKKKIKDDSPAEKMMHIKDRINLYQDARDGKDINLTFKKTMLKRLGELFDHVFTGAVKHIVSKVKKDIEKLPHEEKIAHIDKKIDDYKIKNKDFKKFKEASGDEMHSDIHEFNHQLRSKVIESLKEIKKEYRVSI